MKSNCDLAEFPNSKYWWPSCMRDIFLAHLNVLKTSIYVRPKILDMYVRITVKTSSCTNSGNLLNTSALHCQWTKYFCWTYVILYYARSVSCVSAWIFWVLVILHVVLCLILSFPTHGPRHHPTLGPNMGVLGGILGGALPDHAESAESAPGGTSTEVGGTAALVLNL